MNSGRAGGAPENQPDTLGGGRSKCTLAMRILDSSLYHFGGSIVAQIIQVEGDMTTVSNETRVAAMAKQSTWRPIWQPLFRLALIWRSVSECPQLGDWLTPAALAYPDQYLGDWGSG